MFKLFLPFSTNAFDIVAKVFGIFAAILSPMVWLPQIVKLIKTKDAGSLSLVMFLLQTPGNGVIITLQILYAQNWSTWITYIFILVEQLIIVFLILYYRYQNYKANKLRELKEPLLDSAYEIFEDDEFVEEHMGNSVVG